MPLLGILIAGEPVPFDQVPPDVLMPEIVQALKPDHGRHEDAIHMASLGVCPYTVKMERELGYYLPPESAYRLIRGKSWDTLIERYKRPHAIYHTRYWREFDGVPITGEPDLIDLDLKTIEDYKAPTRDNKRSTAYPSYSWQLNGYAWLTELYMAEHGITIEGLYLNICGPTKPVRIGVPLWSPRTREVEVARRLERLVTVLEDDYLGRCDDDTCIFCSQEALWVPLSRSEDGGLTDSGPVRYSEEEGTRIDTQKTEVSGP